MGCTICKQVSPSIFDIKEKKAILLTDQWDNELLAQASIAAKRCPAKVIHIKEDEVD
ncbi:MAG: ferredoxin [Turicibacter sp.]